MWRAFLLAASIGVHLWLFFGPHSGPLRGSARLDAQTKPVPRMQAVPYYKEIVQRTKDVLGKLKKEFPELGDCKYELAGFGWHQGWNDRVNQAFNDEYEKNMANFIRDIRKDLGVKNLPFVTVETGMSGPNEKHPRALSLMNAQAAAAEYKEFRGNVAFVGTKAFWRDKEVSPTGQAFHWNTNAETYYLIGEAMGKAMIQLCAPGAKSNDAGFSPDQNKLPAQVPKNVIVLLDGKGNHSFLSMAGEKIDWPIKDGVVVPTPKGTGITLSLNFPSVMPTSTWNSCSPKGVRATAVSTSTGITRCRFTTRSARGDHPGKRRRALRIPQAARENLSEAR